MKSKFVFYLMIFFILTAFLKIARLTFAQNFYNSNQSLFNFQKADQTDISPKNIVSARVESKALDDSMTVRQYEEFKDSRDGQSYRIIKIGKQIWFAENLNFDTNDSWCYEENETNCKSCGRLYTWEAAMKSCPPGWHLPTEKEWEQLEVTLGMDEAEAEKTWGMRGTDQGEKLKPGGSSGFEAILCGHRGPSGDFSYYGSSVDFWTSSEVDGNKAWRRLIIDDNAGIGRGKTSKKLGFCVRCIKD